MGPQIEPRKKPLNILNSFPLYWLFNRDPYNGLSYSSYNWVGFHPLKTLNHQGPFFHSSIDDCAKLHFIQKPQCEALNFVICASLAPCERFPTHTFGPEKNESTNNLVTYSHCTKNVSSYLFLRKLRGFFFSCLKPENLRKILRLDLLPLRNVRGKAACK